MEYIFGITFYFRKYCCLRDKNSTPYKNKNVRSNAWNNISDTFNQEGSGLQIQQHIKSEM